MNVVRGIQSEICGITLKQLCVHITGNNWGAADVLSELLRVAEDKRIIKWETVKFDNPVKFVPGLVLSKDAIEFLFGEKNIRRPLEALEEMHFIRAGSVRQGSTNVRAIYFKFTNIRNAMCDLVGLWLGSKKKEKGTKDRCGKIIAQRFARSLPSTVYTVGWWPLTSDAIARAAGNDFQTTLSLVASRCAGRETNKSFLDKLRELDPEGASTYCVEPMDITWKDENKETFNRHISHRVNETLFSFRLKDTENPLDDHKWIGDGSDDASILSKHKQGKLDLIKLQFVAVGFGVLMGKRTLKNYTKLSDVIENLSQCGHEVSTGIGWKGNWGTGATKEIKFLTGTLIKQMNTLGWLESRINGTTLTSKQILDNLIVRNAGYAGTNSLENLGLFFRVFPNETNMVRQYCHAKPKNEAFKSATAVFKELTKSEREIYRAIFPNMMSVLSLETEKG